MVAPTKRTKHAINARSLSMLEQQQKSEALLKETAQADPVMSLARHCCTKYNGIPNSLWERPSHQFHSGSGFLNTNLIGTAASVLQFVYQMGTGGPEDWKLLQEVYLDKRIDSRWRRLNQETTQAFSAYNNAVNDTQSRLAWFIPNALFQPGW